MKTRSIRALSIIAAFSAVLTVSACASQTAVPNLPQVEAKTDAQVKASIAKAYQLIGGALAVVDRADKYEAAINAQGGIPVSVHQAAVTGIVKVTKELDSVTTDIDKKVLTTYAQIKARVDPIVADLNGLLTITRSGGFDWSAFLGGAVNLLMAIIAPGVAGGAVVAY